MQLLNSPLLALDSLLLIVPIIVPQSYATLPNTAMEQTLIKHKLK
jgi:hypothetical protein